MLRGQGNKKAKSAEVEKQRFLGIQLVLYIVNMNSAEIRKRFLDFFRERGHTVVPSSSLLPDDPSVLLTTAGMQQFKRYFTGELDPIKDFQSKNTASIQKSFRTSDIDEVGDESHLTFFEMLGNFSFGGYFKKEAIEYGYEFITKTMGLSIDKVSVFAGDADVPADAESEKIWRALGAGRVDRHGREDNFWGPTGSEGPCGPTTEIYVGGVEGWNIVFNEYYKHLDGRLEKLTNPGVDTGMGLERLAMASQGVPTIFGTDLFSAPLIEPLRRRPEFRSSERAERSLRVIADHVRAATFLIGDGVVPSNKDRGYILRKLIRRAITHANFLQSFPEKVLASLVDGVIDVYMDCYPELGRKRAEIADVFEQEQSAFVKTYARGKKILEKKERLTGQEAFDLYQSYGFPPEVTYEFKPFDWEEFNSAKEGHLKVSAVGGEKKFGGHGLILDTGELKAGSEEEMKRVLRLHTATHLLQQALREVLGNEARQMGSDITPERTRFDFAFPRKMTPDEVKNVENIVNRVIGEDLPVKFEEMPKEKAEKTGALFFFKEKYPERVKVYYVGKTLETAWSKEFCGGPHVGRTGEIGRVKVLKEEAVGAGVRRIRAAVEP